MSAKMPSIEELDAILSHQAIDRLEALAISGESFCRVRRFAVAGLKVELYWFSNAMSVYLLSDWGQSALKNVLPEIHCDALRRCGTWPNRSRLNLQFYSRGQVCLIIPLEPFSEELA